MANLFHTLGVLSSAAGPGFQGFTSINDINTNGIPGVSTFNGSADSGVCLQVAGDGKNVSVVGTQCCNICCYFKDDGVIPANAIIVSVQLIGSMSIVGGSFVLGGPAPAQSFYFDLGILAGIGPFLTDAYSSFTPMRISALTNNPVSLVPWVRSDLFNDGNAGNGAHGGWQIVAFNTWQINIPETTPQTGTSSIDYLGLVVEYSVDVSTGYWDNPVTNHLTFTAGTPSGGNWVSVPAFVPDTVTISPAVGSTAGGDFVSISGVNFDDSSGAHTTIGGNAITTPIVVNSTLITGFTAAHAAGVVDVVLTNGDGSTSTLTGGFTYAAAQWWFIPPIGPYWFGGPPNLPVSPVPPVPPVPQGATPPVDTQGWYWSNTGFSGGSFIAVTPGNPQHARGWDKIIGFATEITSGNLGGLPSVNYKNTIIYAGDDYTLGATGPTVRLFDGVTDRLLVSIPNTPAGLVPHAIMSMLLVGTIVYISTYDSGTTHLTFSGRVFAYDILAQTLTPISTAFTAGEIPYAMAWHMDRLWVGTNRGDGTLGVVYWFRPFIDTAWTTETGTITGGVCALKSFGGQLYIGCSQIAGTFSKIYKRNSDATYSVVATGTGGTARLNNGWLSFSVFNGVLYTGYWNPDTTNIAKVYSITTAGVVALVYTGATDTLAPYLAMFISAGVLYVLGCADEIQVALLSTPDGVTFTDLSAGINNLATETAIPVFGTIGF